MKKRATQADVAREAGLSVTTVSLVLNGRPNTRISSDASRRVREAARRLDYSPDPTARGLRTGRTHTLGFVSEDVTVTRFASDMIRGVLQEGATRNHTVLLAECGEDQNALDKATSNMTDRRVDGLLYAHMRAHLMEVPPLPSGLPVVVVNGAAPGVDSILPDEKDAGARAIRYLTDQGHRRIALLGRPEEPLEPSFSITIERRFEGIDDAMRAAGLEFVHEGRTTLWEPEEGFRTCMAMLARTDRPTALLCANDRLAFGASQALNESGLRVPQDISLLSFDDEVLAGLMRPGLTTFRLPYLEMGRLGVEHLMGARDPAPRGPWGGSETLLPMPLVERGSVSPPA